MRHAPRLCLFSSRALVRFAGCLSKKEQAELYRRIEQAESELLHRIENDTIHDGPTLLALMEAACTALVAATVRDEDDSEDEDENDFEPS